MSETEQCYIGLKACGCLSMVVMEREPRAPQMVANAIKNGGTVERMTLESLRAIPKRCQAHTPPARQETMGFDDVAPKADEGRYPR